MIYKNFSNNEVNKIEEVPGVYMYFNENKNIIYIGKAKNLKNRIKNYLSKTLDRKTEKLVSHIKYISYIKVNTEFEALLLEAKMINKYKPFYNLQLKDDKSPLYILITKELFPRVITARKEEIKFMYKFGPFTNSQTVKYVLKLLRNIFPYATHVVQKRPCFYSQIGLCNPCPSVIEKKDYEEKEKLTQLYKSNIKSIKNVLSGKLSEVKKEILNEIDRKSQNEDFETALLLKRKLDALNYIAQRSIPTQYFMDNPFYIYERRNLEIENLKEILSQNGLKINNLSRIECFDISHISGVGQSASMVVFMNADPDKSKYRHFKLKHVKGNNDFESMKEVARRRIKYKSAWGRPDLIIVDGGKPQVKAFSDIFSQDGIPIIGIAKRFDKLVIPVSEGFRIFDINKNICLNLVQRLRDEAHRFAQKYHHHLMKTQLLEKAL